jgi:hypothetical protein
MSKARRVLVTSVLFVSPLLSGCDSDKGANALVERWKIPRQQCEQLVSSVFKKGYSIDESVPDGQRAERFEKDEAKALEFIRAVDLDLLTFGESEDYLRFIFSHCSDPNKTEGVPVAGCDFNFELTYFLKALNYSVTNNSWTPATKEEAKKLIFKYLKLAASKRTSLVERLMVIHILRDALELSVFDARILSEVKALEDETQKISERVRELSTADTKKWKNGSCGDALALHENEFLESERLGLKLAEILNKIEIKPQN